MAKSRDPSRVNGGHVLDCTGVTVASGVILDMAGAACLWIRATGALGIDGTLTGNDRRMRTYGSRRPDDRLD